MKTLIRWQLFHKIHVKIELRAIDLSINDLDKDAKITSRSETVL